MSTITKTSCTSPCRSGQPRAQSIRSPKRTRRCSGYTYAQLGSLPPLMRKGVLILACVQFVFAAAPSVKAPPPNPSLLSALAHVWQSGTLGPPPGAKGPVRQLTWEKEQLTVGQPGKGLSTT